jgi:hypothetical protein
MSRATTPRVHAMLLCDRIWRDPQTGKWTLLGVFDRIESDGRLALEVYAVLTGLKGTYDFGLDVVGEDGAVLAVYALGERIRSHDAEARLQIGFNVTRLDLPRAGSYAMRLTANGLALHEETLLVLRDGDAA